jgi:uncharacterized repeat protein (TIGR03803 family)
VNRSKIYDLVMLCAAAAIAAPAQTFTTFLSFTGANGANPFSSLVQGTDGNIYGTTGNGGEHGFGTFFKITPAGALTTLYNFGADGLYPSGGVILATDGNFYGMTHNSVSSECEDRGCGTIYKITPSGALTTLHRFAGPDGSFPSGGLLQAANGDLCGLASSGGTEGHGVAFSITTAGTFFTLLHSFAGPPGDGAEPLGSLVQATNNGLYGTTYSGGSGTNCSGGCGTVFQLTPAGSLSTIYTFNETDGKYPAAGLVQASNGGLFGTTVYGGANGDGTVFQIFTSGTLYTASMA